MLFFAVSVAGCLLTSTAAKANPITFTLTAPNQSGAPGDMLTFYATVANASNSGVVIYLNSDSSNVDSPLTVDDSPYNSNSNFWTLTPGYSYTNILFNVNIPLETPAGTYNGYFSVLGEIDPVGTDNNFGTATLATDDFSIQVESNSIPEPSSLLLLLTGMAGFAGTFRRRLI